MAGRGPAPKTKTVRRNLAADFEELPAGGFTGKYPDLPEKGYEVELSVSAGPDPEGDPLTVVVPFREETKIMYKDWATSPMATKFTAPAWNRLRFIIAPLWDQYLRSPSVKLAAEIRLQEQKLGGTPEDMQRLKWRIEADTEKAAAPKAKTPRQRSRAKLQRVK